MNSRSLTAGELTGMGAGFVLFVGSFLPFYESNVGGAEFGQAISRSWNAWADVFNLFPIVPLIVLFGLAIAIRIAAIRFTRFRPGPTVSASARYDLVVSALGTVTLFAFILRDLPSFEIGVGAWALVIGAVAALLGALLRARELGA